MDAFELLGMLLATCGVPMLCLLRARFLLHSGDLAGAARLSTISGTWCWMLMGAGALIAALIWRLGPPTMRHPEQVVLLAAPVPIWFWSRTLYARARASQEEVARAAATPPSGDGGSAARG
jgi:hypothetical protein